MATDAIGNYLKEKREWSGLTLKELSAKIDYSAAYISMVENGKKEKPSYEFLSEIAKGLELNYHALLYFAGYIDYDEFNTAHIEELHEQIRVSKEEIKRIEKDGINNDPDKLKKLKQRIKVNEQTIERRLSGKSLTPSFEETGVKNLKTVDLAKLLDSNNLLYYKGEKLTKTNKKDIMKFIENFVTNRDD